MAQVVRKSAARWSEPRVLTSADTTRLGMHAANAACVRRLSASNAACSGAPDASVHKSITLWKAAISKADPRQQRHWLLNGLYVWTNPS